MNIRRVSPIRVSHKQSHHRTIRLGLVAACLLALLAMAACTATPTPPPVTPTATPLPTITPTPLPAILRLPFARYDAPNGAFSLQAPQNWIKTPTAGGIRFQEGPDSVAQFTAYFQTPPTGVVPEAYLTGIISATLAAPQVANPDAFQILHDEVTLDGHRRIEWVGQIEKEGAAQHLLAEWWLEANHLVGLSLSGPEEQWADLSPLWTILQQSFTLQTPATPQVAGLTNASLDEVYSLPGGVLTFTLPVGWDMVEESEDAALFQDASGLAQFAITVAGSDHAPTPKDLQEALRAAVGDLAEQETYQEIANEQKSLHERVLQFDVLSPQEGLYRTELRAFTSGNNLITTSFSAPPHDWDLNAPAYTFFLNSLQLGQPPLDEAIQDADPLAGIEVGPALFYHSQGDMIWVSAAIHNGRTRNLGDLTASIQLYDADGNLLGAESWRLAQQVVRAGGNTYLTVHIPAAVAAIDKVNDALVQIVDAEDTDAEAPVAWEYVTGATDTTDDGSVIIKATLRNPTDKVRRTIYVTGLLYDADGKLVFARADTQRLRYAVPGGAEVDVEIKFWGPFPEQPFPEPTSFDVVGEVPR